MWRIRKGRVERLIVFSDVGGAFVPAGELLFEGKRSVFRYARSYLQSRDAWDIDPIHLPRRPKAVQSDPHEVPLVFHDAGPDGWGKGILEMAYPDQIFGMAEYLAATGSERAGALGFGAEPVSGPERFIPQEPLVTLPSDADDLEALADAIEAVESAEATSHHLQLLVRNSADMGGARPKAQILQNGFPHIAKFPARGDSFDEPKMEAVCLSLARDCGVEVPDHEIISVGARSVLMIRRFDRELKNDGSHARLGYLSAATILDHDPTAYATHQTYPDIAARAREIGAVPCEADLFRRMLVNCGIHNTDDHLRNHAFIRSATSWRLSPAFDLVPQKQERLVLRPGRTIPPLPDPKAAFEAHPEFRLSRDVASDILDEVLHGLRSENVRTQFDRYDVSKKDRDLVTQRLWGMGRGTERSVR